VTTTTPLAEGESTFSGASDQVSESLDPGRAVLGTGARMSKTTVWPGWMTPAGRQLRR
jgi:hypothetical protein